MGSSYSTEMELRDLAQSLHNEAERLLAAAEILREMREREEARAHNVKSITQRAREWMAASK
jgi:hypothetical protein